MLARKLSLADQKTKSEMTTARQVKKRKCFFWRPSFLLQDCDQNIFLEMSCNVLLHLFLFWFFSGSSALI